MFDKIFGDICDFNPFTQAFNTLCGLAEPSDFATTSWIPNISKTFAEPHFDEIFLLPCFATFISFADNTIATADEILIDTPAMEKTQTFDFKILKGVDITRHFLAGGINTENLKLAMQNTNKIDVSSGLENAKGIKDNKKIETDEEDVSSRANLRMNRLVYSAC